MNGKGRMIMKHRYSIIALICMSAILSCTQLEESFSEKELEPVELVSLTISATIEKETGTRTALEGSLSDAVMRTVWVPSDNIGVVAAHSEMSAEETVYEFVSEIEENSEAAAFKGTTSYSSEYYAFYPYDASLTCSNGDFIYSLPEEQTHVPGSFDPHAAPMVAKAGHGDDFNFKNLCGLLALQLTGEDDITDITFIGYDASGEMMPVCGKSAIDMSYTDEPALDFQEVRTSVTLRCETPVSLDNDEAVPFYFVLPPATYSSFRLMIHTSEGKVMLKEGTKPLTITRSHIKPTTALQYAETVYMDLSERGCSNSYVVPKAGLYSFDATTIGNGEFGLLQNAVFHTDDVKISPESVELLWTDKDNLMSGLNFSDGKVNFYAMGNEGNAFVAVKDGSGTILWSWHLWFTDTPVEQTYENSAGTFKVLDRNIGATRADRGTGDEWKESSGLLYQWGRKDPFADGKYDMIDVALYMSEIISMPTTYVVLNAPWTNEWSDSFWDSETKTVYDPCPVGYKVAKDEIWAGFTTTGANVDRRAQINSSGSFDYGWNFYIDGENTAWYPVTPHIGYSGPYEHHTDIGYCWKSNRNSSQSNLFEYYYSTDLKCHVKIVDYWASICMAFPVRCMKDEGYLDVSTYIELASPEVSETSMTTAKITSETKYGFSLEITEKGFIYGTDPDLSDGTKVRCEGGHGEFSYSLDGLSPNTIYYVQSYVVAETGTTYSETIGFRTYFSDSISGYNLSADGTSNCYIVSDPGDYAFDASVKGNSSGSVGTPVQTEVLWESVSCTGKAESGTVISSVTLNGSYIQFSVPSPLQEGNALIALKDDSGTVLWSWHIWVTDVPAEQTYVNSSGTFVVLDRNLGATRADRGTGEEWKQSCGIDYFWGRKDPFMGYCHSDISSAYTVEDAIRNPTVKDSNWGYGPSNDLWAIDHKTIYDPCPVGYRVAVEDVWSDFSLSETSGSFDNGWYFLYNGTDSAWYSNRARHSPNGIAYWGDNYLNAAEQRSGFYASSSYINTSHSVEYAPLRCMKE